MLTLVESAHAMGATLVGVTDAQLASDVTSVSTDSRQISQGALFFAIPGEHFNGADFVTAAVTAGAVAVVVADAVAGLPCLVVPDVVAAYGQLAAEHVRVLRARGLVVVGITGSSGKTTTKDLLTSVLGSKFDVLGPAGSLNNDIGLPATVLKTRATTEVLILEMGMRGPGEIARLCRIAPPDISVVLNVGSAHIGQTGSLEATAAAKQEIVEHAAQGATAVLNADDARVSAMAACATGHVLFYGEAEDADVRASDIIVTDSGTAAFQLHLPNCQPEAVQLRILGRHQVANACAVAAVAHRLGMSSAAIAHALSAAEIASRWRLEVTPCRNNITVINDAYNANLESMMASLRTLASIPCEGRRIAVLGEMRELGEQSVSAHNRVGALTRELGIDVLVAVGEAGRWIAAGRNQEPVYFAADSAAAVELVLAEVAPGDAVLCKASRSIELERVGAALVAELGTVSP